MTIDSTQIGDGAGNALTGSDLTNDQLIGGNGDDTLSGLGGDDSLVGGGNNDSLIGGDGDDTLKGGANQDTLRGGTGNDSIDGGGSSDLLVGGAGNDSITGGNGDDTLKGDGDDDTLEGGTGNDKIRAGDGDDLVDGGEGNDSILGGDGADTLMGGDGDDTLRAGKDNDADVIVVDADDGYDRVFQFDSELDLIRLVGGLADYTLEVNDTTGDALLSYGATTVKIFNYDTATELLIDRDGINDGPLATAIDAGTVTEDDPAQQIDLLATARDADGDMLQATGISIVDNTGAAVAYTDLGGGRIEIDPAQFDALTAGDSRTLTVSYTVDDGNGGTVANTATLVVEGANDAASFGGDVTGAVTEDAALQATGTLSVTDVDTGEDGTQEQSGVAGTYGSFSVDAAGNWTYDLDNTSAAVQALAAGQTETETFTVDSIDGTASETVTITVNGTNDAPMVSALTDTVSEQDPLATFDLLNGQTDVDTTDTLSAINIIARNSDGGAVSFTDNGDGTISIDPNQFDALETGETETVTVSYDVSDGTAEVPNALTLTVTGFTDNIAPVAVDDGPLGVLAGSPVDIQSATLLFNDTDPNGNALSILSLGTPATAGATASLLPGGATVVYDPTGVAAFQALPEGVTATDTFTYTVSDGSLTDTGTVTMTITGVNDDASISGDASGAVTEDGTLQATGTLSVTDVDTGEAGTQAQTDVAGTYGSFSVDTAGNWTYDLDNTSAAVQALAGGGAEQKDTFTVTSFDGSATDTVTINVFGTNDPASIAGEITGLVTEDDATDMVTGKLTVTDVDTGEAGIQALSNVPGIYGRFSVTADGDWTYTLDNSDPDTEALGTGDVGLDHFIVTSIDGTIHPVAIGVRGNTDATPFTIDFEDVAVSGTQIDTLSGTYRGFTWDAAPASGSPGNPTVVVGANLPTSAWTGLTSTVMTSGSFRDPIVIAEVDGDDFRFDGIDLALDDFATNTTVTLTGFNGSAQIWSQTVSVGTNGFTSITSTETALIDRLEIGGYSHNIAVDNIQLARTESANLAVISGDVTGSVTEDTALIETGTLMVADGDAGENFVLPGTFTGSFGTFTVESDSTWRYDLNNGNATVQNLNSGQSVTDSFTVTSADGDTTQVVDITINGQDEGGAQQVIDFEDLGHFTLLPATYEGFNWSVLSNSGTLPLIVEDLNDGAWTNLTTKVAITNGHTSQLTITSTSGDAFDFVSIDLQGSSDTANIVNLSGYNDNTLVDTVAIALSQDTMNTFDGSAWADIDELRIHGYQVFDGVQFEGDIAFDNFIIA